MSGPQRLDLAVSKGASATLSWRVPEAAGVLTVRFMVARSPSHPRLLTLSSIGDDGDEPALVLADDPPDLLVVATVSAAASESLPAGPLHYELALFHATSGEAWLVFLGVLRVVDTVLA